MGTSDSTSFGTGSGTIRTSLEGLTLAEAARLVGVSERALRKRADRGTLKHRNAIRSGRSVVVVDLADLRALYPNASLEGGPAPSGPALEPRPEPGPEPELRASIREETLPEPLWTTPAQSRGELVERLQEELAEARRRLGHAEHDQAELRDQLAHTRGELSMAAKVEASAQRVADRLEEKLADARRESLSLARALGQAEAQRDQVRLQLEARRGWFRRLVAH